MLKPIVMALTLFGASAAAADELVFFRSPTGNINCLIATGSYAEVRCDLTELVPSFTRRPDDCDLDWGDSFVVADGADKGGLSCHGDTVRDPGAAVLDYGHSIEVGPFVCNSAKTGMTCTNALGHGFSVARAKQSVF